MELLGKSLDSLFTKNKDRFSLKTVCMIGIQMVQRVELLHEKSYIHRDIKPDNFVVGLDDLKTIYILDFGLSKKYRNKQLIHNPIKNNKKLTGTARYASINALKGLEQSRRDDLESIGYCLVYFLKGKLPWQGLQVKKNEDKYVKIYEKKKSVSSKALCTNLPSEFYEFVDYTRELGYDQDPDYEYLKNLMKSVIKNNKLEIDYKFDWCSNAKQLTSTSSSNLFTNSKIRVGDNKIRDKVDNRNSYVVVNDHNKLNTVKINEFEIHEEFVKMKLSNNTNRMNSEVKDEKRNLGVSMMVVKSEIGNNNDESKIEKEGGENLETQKRHSSIIKIQNTEKVNEKSKCCF